MKIVAGGGGIYRVVGRKSALLVKGSRATVAVAASGNDVAFVPAVGASTTDGHPLASAAVPVEVRDVPTGSLVTSISPNGVPVAIALSGGTLAILGKTAGKLVLDWYEMPTGKPLGSLRLPPTTAPALSVGDNAIVFRVGRSIRVVDLKTKRVRTIATAAATPVGLSIAGRRVAWAENVAGRGAHPRDHARTVKTLAVALLAATLAGGAGRSSGTHLIVFTADRAPSVTGDVYRADANGRVTNLTHSPWQETMPMVSPSGKLVAFVSDRLGGGVWTIGDRRHRPAPRVGEGFPVPVLHGDRVVAR